MTDITKISLVTPVEALRNEALAATNLQQIDIDRAAAGSTFIQPPGAAPAAVTLLNSIDNPSGLALLPDEGTQADIDSSSIRNMIDTLVTTYSRARLIRYVRTGDGFTYERVGRVVSPDPDPSRVPMTDFGNIFGTNPVSASEYTNVVATAAAIMRANFVNLFAVIPYCHVQCHSDCHNSCHNSCHSSGSYTADRGDGGDDDSGDGADDDDDDDGAGSCDDAGGAGV